MSRSRLILPFFKTLISQPSIILKALYHGIERQDRRNFVVKKYGLENGLPEVSLLDLFSEFNETIDPFSHLYGTSLPIDLALLKQLAKSFKDCEYLEIGSWRGESLANIAPWCKRCVSISLSDEEMRELGVSEQTIKMQRFFSKNTPNVEHIGTDSTKFDFSTIGNFDLIFVDGDHRFNAVLSDTKNVIKLLKNETSVIVWHDYAEHYELINWEVLAGILAGLPKEKHSKLYHVTNTICAILYNQPIKSENRTFPKTPELQFKLDISTKRYGKD